jgi:hypothetical protein
MNNPEEVNSNIVNKSIYGTEFLNPDWTIRPIENETVSSSFSFSSEFRRGFIIGTMF